MRAETAWYMVGYSRNPSPPEPDCCNEDCLSVDLRDHRGEAGQVLVYRQETHAVCVVDVRDSVARMRADSEWSLPACSTEQLADWLDQQDDAFSALRDTFHPRYRDQREQTRLEELLDAGLDAVGEVQ